VQLEIGRLELASSTDIDRPVDRLPRGVGAVSLPLGSDTAQFGQVLADHLRDEHGTIEFPSRVLALSDAVAQHRDAIADRVDLFEEVRDEEDRNALLSESAQRSEQGLDLLSIEAGRRFVEHEDLGMGHHRPRDGDELLHRRRQCGHRESRVEFTQTQLFEHRHGAPPRSTPRDAVPAPLLMADHHVLGDREIVAEIDVLERGCDARSLRRGRT
jgi:hypothetical protein